jgi:hypothetical protein
VTRYLGTPIRPIVALQSRAHSSAQVVRTSAVAICARFTLLALLVVTASALQAQRNTVASGGDVSGIGGSLSFSVGQVDRAVITSPGGSVQQGVQQPYQVTLTTVHEEHDPELSFGAFPNPTREQLFLEFNGELLPGSYFTLRDDRGRTLSTRNIDADLLAIPIEGSAQGVYFLEVRQGGVVIKSFRIVKQ